MTTIRERIASLTAHERVVMLMTDEVRFVDLAPFHTPHHVWRRIRQMAMHKARQLGLTKDEWRRIRLESIYPRPRDADQAFLGAIGSYLERVAGEIAP